VVASIFVNPCSSDRTRILRVTRARKRRTVRRLEGLNTDLVFMPDVATMYPHPLEQLTRVHVPLLGEILDGAPSTRSF